MRQDVHGSSDESSEPRSPMTVLIVVLCVAIGSFVLGGATSYAQGFLPDDLQAFANSASGWTLLTVLLVFAARLPWTISALLGAVSFVLLTVGYAVVATWRGFFYDPLMFSVIGIIVGPFVGVAACWLRSSGRQAALSVALLAGIGIGEGIYGLTVVAETTSPVYWVFIIGIAVVLIAYALLRRVRGVVPVLTMVLGTLAIAAAFNVAYTAIG